MESISHEKWENLSISNDFLFGKVMRNPNICKKLIESILDIKIGHIEYPEGQKAIDIALDAKSVRLDVYAADSGGTVYNLEMQASNTRELPRRARYYQGMIDLNMVEKGERYWELDDSYVIFICTFDAFGKGRHIYTFENTCKEEKGLKLLDGATKIFLNSAGTADDVSGDLKAFLSYVAGEESQNQFVQEIDMEVQKAKNNKEWRREYMTLLMRDQENIEKGFQIGREAGEKIGREAGEKIGREAGEKRIRQINRLNTLLIRDRRYDDLERSANDADFQNQLMEEYGL